MIKRFFTFPSKPNLIIKLEKSGIFTKPLPKDVISPVFLTKGHPMRLYAR